GRMRAIVVAVLACATVFGSVLVLARTFQTRNRGNDLVNVTGLTKRDFVSDLIVWKGSFVRRSAELKPAYESLVKDQETVQGFAAAHDIRKAEAVFSSVEIEKEYDEVPDKSGHTRREFKGYLLTQRVELESPDVDRIERFSREVTGLIDSGVE